MAAPAAASATGMAEYERAGAALLKIEPPVDEALDEPEAPVADADTDELEAAAAFMVIGIVVLTLVLVDSNTT